MDTVYVETTVIGNIAGRIHPDPAIAARQQVTRVWWATAADRYRLFVSQLALDECGEGDSDAARERLDVLRGVDMVSTPAEAEELATLLVARLAVPASQPRDALHIAIATVHRVQFIVTWNFKHILNPHVQLKIAGACREAGFEPPVICTPNNSGRPRMTPDPTDEIRAIKRKLSEKFDNDIHRIAEDARRRQIESGRPTVPVSSPSPTMPFTANQHMHRGGESSLVQG